MVFLKSEKNSIACIIGINYTNTDGQLNGCINDADKIKDFLIHKLDYNDIYYLTDDSETKPTYENILRTLDELLDKIVKHKIKNVWFSYSGHGSYVRDYNKDEQVNRGDRIGNDEALVPLDYMNKGLITDDILYNRFIKKLPKYVTMVSLIDACHSGSMLDLPYLFRSDTEQIETNTSIKDMATLAKIIKISGCNDGQTSADAYIANKYQGAMTYSFFKTLDLYNYNISCKHLVKQMVRYLSGNKYTQIPTISLTNIDYLNELLIGDKILNSNTNIKLVGDRWCNTETSWNIYSHTTQSTIYDKNKMFDIQNETLEIDIYLEDGDYDMILYDMYGDGGLLGEICSRDTKLCDIRFITGKVDKYSFTIKTNTKKVQVDITGDVYSHIESSWNIQNSKGECLFEKHVEFTRNVKNHTKQLELERGEYNVVLLDTWGDGGLSGSIIDLDTNKKYLDFNWKSGKKKLYTFIVD
jgi:hypothetical protein